MEEKHDEYISKFYVAGVKFHDFLDVEDRIESGMALSLVPEPTNEYDPFAIRIEFDGTMLGYVPKTESEKVTSWITSKEKKFTCTVEKVNKMGKPWHKLMVIIKRDYRL